jgi:HTH-type transcriptional regulator / antitoxin HipB
MRIRNATDIGLIIRDRRKALGLDQKALAARAGVGRQWIVSVEKGKPRAEVDLILRTLDALGLRVLVEASESSPTSRGTAAVDLNAVIDRARRRRS